MRQSTKKGLKSHCVTYQNPNSNKKGVYIYLIFVVAINKIIFSGENLYEKKESRKDNIVITNQQFYGEVKLY